MKASFGDFMSEDGKLWDYIKALLIGGGTSWILYSMWGPTGLVIGLGVTAIASLAAVIENGGINSAESVLVALTGIASAAVTGRQMNIPAASHIERMHSLAATIQPSGTARHILFHSRAAHRAAQRLHI
jgi:hypothetical protein